MNEYQNAGENCAFLQCGPCRRYLYAGISQDIRSSSLHMYYYIVILKNVGKFKGMQILKNITNRTLNKSQASRRINLANNETGRSSKMILDKINLSIKIQLNLN